MSDASVLPPAVRQYVRGFVVRGRRLALLRGAGLAAACLLTAALVACGVDRAAPLPSWLRLTVLVASAVAAMALVARPIARLLRREFDWVAAAHQIERQDARFGQRLVTITSRLLGRPEHRGSDEILEHLVYELDREVAGGRAGAPLTVGQAARPWACVALGASACVASLWVPGLGLPALAHRYVAPLADLPPVTTTRLRVTPGDRDVPQSSPLPIEVEADRPGDGPAWLVVSEDGGREWSRLAMSPAGEPRPGVARFAYTLSSADRDLRYYVVGGDAASPQYAVRVLRRPAVSEFHVRYVYPAYTRRPPLVVTNTDGAIDAPVGTEVVLTITATEPLQSALLTVAGEKTLMSPAGADNVRQGRLTVVRDGRYEIDLISTREQTGSGPPTMLVKAQPDRPPVVRLTRPTDGLRVRPRDVVPLAFEASDDYGLDSVVLRVQAGVAPPVDLPTDAAGDDDRAEDAATPQDATGSTSGEAATTRAARAARSRRGVVSLDLATMPLAVGDLLTATFVARDTAGNVTTGDAVQAVVGPRSIDVRTREWVAALDAAVDATAALADEWNAAAVALTKVLRASSETEEQARRALSARASRSLAGAAEAAGGVRRALLHAGATCDPTTDAGAAFAAWTDAAQAQASAAEALFRAGVDAPADLTAAAEAVRRLSAAGRALQSALQDVARGERAAALRADEENLAAWAGKLPPADPKATAARRKALQRARDEFADGVARLGLDPAAADLDAQLAARVESAAAVRARAHGPVDFAGAARDPEQWRPDRPALTAPIEDRLTAAAQLESARPGADARRAADLERAARAAAAIRLSLASARGGPTTAADATADFAAALAAIARDDGTARNGGPDGPAGDADATRRDAERARERMNAWAGAAPAVPVRAHVPARGEPLVAVRAGAAGRDVRPPRGRPGDDPAAASSREPDALPEFDAALRAYFDVLSKAHDGGK